MTSMPDNPANPKTHLDALIVGAGPTGLALAAQLHRFGARFRIVDRLRSRMRESRALGVQARSLEILDALGLARELISRGSPAVRIVVHLGRGRTIAVRIDDIGIAGTQFPYILFVSQAETEAVLSEHLERAGVRIERGVELTAFEMGEEDVTCRLRHDDGRVEHVRALYLAGCDGAHSIVRKASRSRAAPTRRASCWATSRPTAHSSPARSTRFLHARASRSSFRSAGRRRGG